MSPTKDRQRTAARARLEREMAARAEAARRRRRLQVSIGAGVAALIVIVGTVWLVASLGDDDKSGAGASPSASAGPLACTWNTGPSPDPAASPAPPQPNVKDVGLPPTAPPRTGTRTMVIDTNLGTIKAKIDLSKTPCTAASFTYLASKDFFNDTKCHRLVTEGLKVLQCGDPTAKGPGYRDTDGTGGPSYRFDEENLPVGERPAYPEGVIAMAKSQDPGSTGSQFFIVYGDTELDASYTLLGTITEGLDIVKQVGAAGDDGAYASSAGGGHPKKEVLIKSLTMTQP